MAAARAVVRGLLGEQRGVAVDQPAGVDLGEAARCVGGHGVGAVERPRRTRRRSTTSPGVGTMPARPAVEEDRDALDRQANVLDHLAGGQLDHEDRAEPRRELGQRRRRERPQRDRPEQADAQAVGAGSLDRGPGDARGGAVGDDDDLGVLELLARPADLALGDRRELRLEVLVVALEILGLEVERADDAGVAPVGAGQLPGGGVPVRASGTWARTGSIAWPWIPSARRMTGVR